MAKKKGRSKDKPAQKPKSLQKQLRQAEAALHKAMAKRDRAQARVDAHAIIADEIRARLAEAQKAEKVEAGQKDKAAKSAPPAKPAAKRKRAKPAAATPPVKKPA